MQCLNVHAPSILLRNCRLVTLNSILLFHAALEITGHDHMFIVGQTAELSCSTLLNISKLEWFIVGFDIPLEESNTQESFLPLDLTSTSLDGAMFTCRATTTSGGVYEDTVTISVKGY